MNLMQLQVTDLFATRLKHWGLCGDPYLWDALGEHFVGKAWPDSAEIFHEQLKAAFTELTNHSLDNNTPFTIKQFSHGGTSSGMISPQFWRELAFPILLKSYRIAVWRVEHALEKLQD